MIRAREDIVKELKGKFVRCAWHDPGKPRIVERKTGWETGHTLSAHLDKYLPMNEGICDPCAQKLREGYATSLRCKV